jgi:ribonuclease D
MKFLNQYHFPFVLKDKSLNSFFNKKTLYDELRSWRRSTAKLYHVSPRNILSDRILLQISKVKPKDFVELEAIPGISTTKLNKFGDDILDLIH